MTHLLRQWIAEVAEILPTSLTGSVVQMEGATAAVAGFSAPVGALVAIERQTGAAVAGEVIGFRDDLTLVHALGDLGGVRYGNRVRLRRTRRMLRIGDALLGRVIDAFGQPLDGRPPPLLTERTAVNRPAPPACSRPCIDRSLGTGVRAIDGLLPCGRGQRIGVFAGGGVGKSTLLGMLAKYTAADVSVIALIGERGREVNEFLENILEADGLRRSVVVVATSDQPAPLRVAAALTATAVAEYFRDRGRDVLLAMDSLTRLAAAQRELALASGETAVARGYPPSVFAALARLVERAGRSQDGSITAFYTVLADGDDLNEPVSDAVRSLLDGHVVLSRRLAAAGHYPAIDVLESISRLAPAVASPPQLAAAARLRALLAAYRDHEDLLALGAYRSGTNATVDAAVRFRERINGFLRQDVHRPCTLEAAQGELLELAQATTAA